MSKKRPDDRSATRGDMPNEKYPQDNGQQMSEPNSTEFQASNEHNQTPENITGDSESMSEENLQPSTPNENAVSTTVEDYEKQIASLKQEVEDFRNRAMRWQAELENYQKRVARQLAEERRYAGMDLIRDLLPVYDNLQRASQSAEQNHDIAQLLQGLRMIVKQWEDVLARHHCQKIEALHKPFDPNVHHAISRQATGDVPPNTVIYVAQDGFVLHDRVVRPSQVVVSMALPTAGGEGPSEPSSAASPETPDNHPPS